MNKVLVVGLDGATFDIIRPLAAQGRLPTLAGMLKSGAWGALQSTIPPITPAAWTSVFTGKNPGKHGIFDFGEFDGQTYQRRQVRFDQHQEKPVWELLGEAGKRSLVIDVPFTYPPRPLSGWMISGFGTPRTAGTVCTYPGNLAELLPEELRAEVRVAIPAHRFDRSPAFLDEWAGIMDGRERLLEYLIKEQDWDFFFVVLTITDNLSHIFWTYLDPNHPNYHKAEGRSHREALYQAYTRSDEILGRLIGWAGPQTNTLVMSDHGFGSVYPRQYLFQKLVEAGYLSFRKPAGTAGLGSQLQKLAMRTYSNFPFLREWVKNLRPQSQTAMRKALGGAGMLPGLQAVDPLRSQVLPSDFGLQLWLNDSERFSRGLVSTQERDGLLDEISAYLLSLNDRASGRPVFARVHRGSQIYSGQQAAAGPDLLLEHTNLFGSELPAGQSNPFVEGSHTLEGVFLAAGPDIRAARLEQASLIDIAPTILSLSGQPVPPDMDGQVLRAALNSQFLSQNPVRMAAEAARRSGDADPQADLTPEEAAEIEEQLRQLGYL